MKKEFVSIMLALVFLVPANSGWAFSLWKTCMDYDESFNHHIIDTKTLRIKNRKYTATMTVLCPDIEEIHAFSFYKSGKPLHPDSSVTFPNRDNGEICKGDYILVYDDECVIISMDKSRRDDPEMKQKEKKKKNESFILIKRKEELEKLNNEIE